MSMKYSDEEYHQMTIEELYEVEIKPNLFAVSRIFAEAHKQMNLAEYKVFTLGLSRIDWTQPCPDTIYFDKKELASVIGIQSDIDHLSQDLKRAIGQMPKHSFIEFDEKGKDFYVSGNFVRTIAMFKNVVRLKIEDEFLGLFGNLDAKKEVSKYITMWSGDVFRMKSERAVLFYELLRDNSDTREAINSGTVGIKKFKEMFDIPKDGKGSYMREKGGFDRKNFETRVIDPLCEELQKTEMITLILTPEGKYYEKIKNGNRVIAYKFYWTINDPKPRIEENDPDPEEIIEPQEKRELWESALDEFNFSREELDAIGARLYMIPQEAMFSNSAAYGSIELDRYHFMDMRAKDLRLEDKKNHVRNKCKYLIKVIENDYIPKGV